MQLQLTSKRVGIVVLGLGILGLVATTRVHTQPVSPANSDSATQERKVGARITDAWITMKIHSQFVPEDALEDSNIDVDTAKGVVTLSGTVAAEAGRARAIAIAKATDGVKSVNDKLRIAPPADKTPAAAKAAGRRVTDGWIKSKIYAQYLTENALEDSDIDVDVQAGVVTLNGTVVTDAGRTRAVAIAKATDGVKNVKDALKVAKP